MYYIGLARKGEEVAQGTRQYQQIINELKMIDGIAMEGKRVIIPFQLQQQILQTLHSNHMPIGKMWLLAHKSVYWLNMNTDIL